MESYILLDNIQIYANHGVFSQETLVGNYFVINLKVKVELEQVFETDNISDTISYALLYDLIKKEVEINSMLIEHVAGRIIASVKKTFPQIKQIELKLSKMNPPIGGQVESASILIIEDLYEKTKNY